MCHCLYVYLLFSTKWLKVMQSFFPELHISLNRISFSWLHLAYVFIYIYFSYLSLIYLYEAFRSHHRNPFSLASLILLFFIFLINLYDIIWAYWFCKYLQKAAQDQTLPLVMIGSLHSTLVGILLVGPAATSVTAGVTVILNRMVVIMKVIHHQARAAAPLIGCHQLHLRAFHHRCPNIRKLLII